MRGHRRGAETSDRSVGRSVRPAFGEGDRNEGRSAKRAGAVCKERSLYSKEQYGDRVRRWDDSLRSAAMNTKGKKAEQRRQGGREGEGPVSVCFPCSHVPLPLRTSYGARLCARVSRADRRRGVRTNSGETSREQRTLKLASVGGPSTLPARCSLRLDQSRERYTR
jgi:hypothetical protein